MAAGVNIKAEPDVGDLNMNVLVRTPPTTNLSAAPSAYQEYDEKELAKMFGLSEFVNIPKMKPQPQTNAHTYKNETQPRTDMYTCNTSSLKEEPAQERRRNDLQPDPNQNFPSNQNQARSPLKLQSQLPVQPYYGNAGTLYSDHSHGFMAPKSAPNGYTVQLELAHNFTAGNNSVECNQQKRLKKSITDQVDVSDPQKILTQYTYLCPLCTFKSAHRVSFTLSFLFIHTIRIQFLQTFSTNQFAYCRNGVNLKLFA